MISQWFSPRLFIAGALVIPLSASCQPRIQGCVPAYRIVRGIVGPFADDAAVAIIGCREELDTLTDSDLSALAWSFQSVLSEHFDDVLARIHFSELRDTLTRNANGCLGRNAITDVFLLPYFESVGLWQQGRSCESAPAEPELPPRQGAIGALVVTAWGDHSGD